MKMIIPSHIQAGFTKGQTLLVFCGKQVFLASPDAVFTREGGPGEVQFTIVDLKALFERFSELSGDQVEFSKREIAKAACVAMPSLTYWVGCGILSATIVPPRGAGKPAVFSSLDCFTAALAGSLRRQGLPIRMIAKAANYIRNGARAEAMA